MWYKIENDTLFYSNEEFAGSSSYSPGGSDGHWCTLSGYSYVKPYDNKLIYTSTFPSFASGQVWDLSGFYMNVGSIPATSYNRYGSPLYNIISSVINISFPRGMENLQENYARGGAGGYSYYGKLFGQAANITKFKFYDRKENVIPGYLQTGYISGLASQPVSNITIETNNIETAISIDYTKHEKVNFNVNNFTNLKEYAVYGLNTLSGLFLPKLTRLTTDAKYINDCYLPELTNFSDPEIVEVSDVYTLKNCWNFNNCTKLKKVSIPAPPKNSNLSNWFSGCSLLEEINICYDPSLNYNWTGTDVFTGCVSLVGGKGTTYNSSHTNYEYARNDTNENPGYFKYTSSECYEISFINSQGFKLSAPYNVFPKGSTIEIEPFFNASYYDLDYLLQYDASTGNWNNIGKNLSGEILNNQKFIIIPKLSRISQNVKVSLTSVPSNSCTLAGAGTYKVGDNVIITAKPNEGYVFKQWEELINETWIILSYDKEYTIEAIGRDRTIRAVCVEDTSEEVVEITLSLKGGSGSLEGAGKYVKGTKATIKVNVGSRSVFKSWNLPNDSFVVSTQNPYTFTVVKSIEYQAILADNPYGGGGTTEEGGGNGDFNDYIDFTPIPPLNLSATNTDLLSIYTLDRNGVNELAKFIYSDIFDATYAEKLNSILKLFGDVMDQIVSFGIVPFTVPGKSSNIMPYLDIHAPVHCKIPYSQYITINCGTKTIGNYWNNFLDYSPYTKYELYLPFIGYKEIDADEIVNKNLSIKYRVDILTGDLVCFITIDEKVRYQFGGNCLISLPLNSSAKDTGSVISGVASLTTAVGGLLLGSGTAAGAGITGAAVNLITDKQSIKHGSSLSSSSNYLGLLNPVLYITRPRQNVPADYGKIKGYPSNITTQLKNLNGYTVIDEIHLENMSATDDEIEEIETLLKQGVIIN